MHTLRAAMTPKEKRKMKVAYLQTFGGGVSGFETTNVILNSNGSSGDAASTL